VKLDLVIPTLNRHSKLMNCIRSIERTRLEEDDMVLHIYFSRVEEFNDFPVKKPWLKTYLLEKYRASSFWNSHLKVMKADAMCYLNDDVEFIDDTIDKIFLNFVYYFKDYDGVIGLNQYNLPKNQAVSSAFGVIGKKFADRFPDRKVFCEEYHRFYLDFEMGLFANKLNKFKFCEDCKIIHHHPAFEQNKVDSTHMNVRKWLSKDRETFIKRQKAGLLWGETFNHLKKE